MATGQTILTLASIVLLSIITMSIRSMYVQSVNQTVSSQETADALNFGRDIAETLHSYAFRYDQLDSDFGSFNDVTDENSRIEFESQIEGILYATVELFSEEELIQDQLGRRATIRIYKEKNEGDFRLEAEYRTVITNLSIN